MHHRFFVALLPQPSTEAELVVTLEWSHGGGYRPALAIWRVQGRPFAVIEAGQA